MMRKINKKTKNNASFKNETKGITLITLVITIIVLLILAAVSISMLAGDNGILKKAVQAKEVTEHSQIEEEVSMVYMEVLTDHYNSNNYEFASSFQERLRETNDGSEEDTVTYDASNEIYRIYYKGYFFEISTTSGNVTTNRQEEKEEISDALSKIESDLTADNIQQQLPDMVVTEDSETGKIVIEGNESTWEVDPVTGEITEAAPKDVTPPEVTLTTYSVTSKSITVEAKATDYESGLLETDTYKFYIADSQIYPDEPTATNTTGTYTFENLDTNTQYYIKVEVEDQSGNVGTAERSEITQLIPSAETAVTKNITWSSDGTATVTLTTSTEYAIQYGTDGVIWNDYKDALSLQNGEKVYIVLTDGRNYGESYQLTVEDNDPPTITVTGVAGSNYITAKATAIDTGAGVSDTATYHYYIKKDGEDDSSYQLYDSVASSEYTFTGLTANTRYVIKVTTTDLLGNEGEGLATVPTSQFVYVTGNIEFSNVSWSNGTASVNIINNKTEYRIQYQIIEPEGTANDSNWIESTSNSTTLKGLANGTTVIARLYDGTNATADYATCSIQDNTAPQITEVTKMPEDWTKDSVTLTVTAVDNESGLAPEAYSFDGGLSWQTSNQKNYTENTNNIAISVRDNAGIVTSYTDVVNITNIDKLGPVINAEVSTKGEEVTIEVTSSIDAGVGLADSPYNYYISNSYDDLDSTSPSENLQKVENSSSATQTFTTVVGTTYYIKVEAKDQFGNASKVYRTITAGTLEVDENALKISGATWKNEKASVEITKTVTEYNIEYQVVEKGENFDLNGTWQKVTENTVTVTDLYDDYIVYARLADGQGNYGTMKSQEVQDENRPQITKVNQVPESWTQNSVTITVTAEDNESGLAPDAYSFDGGANWQASNEKEFTQNTSNIMIQVKDNAGNVTEYETPIHITNIDKAGPTIQAEIKANTTRNITVEVTNVEDTGSGMEDTPSYTYAIKRSGETSNLQTKTTSQTSYTFDNLTANQNYVITVTAEDNLGNVGIATLTSRTTELPVPDITFSEVIWHNSLATVTVSSSNDQYDLQYEIIENGGNIDLTESLWTTVDGNTVTIEGIHNKAVIYVRLTDNYNTTESYASIGINNPAKETYTESELAGTTRGTFDILGVSVASNTISAKISGEQENTNTYNYYYKTVNDEEYTLISTNTYYDEPAVITDITAGETYQIKVLVLAESGTVTRSQNTAVTIAAEQAKTNTTYASNRTYIDENGYTMTLPASFKISSNETENAQTNGIVISDSNNNEYVWIPVNDAIYDGITTIPNSTTSTSTYKPMAVLQTETNNFYQSIVYGFNGTNSYRYTSNVGIGYSGYKEPSLLTGYAGNGYSWKLPTSVIGQQYDTDEANMTKLGFDSSEEFGIYLANSYNNMITSVDSYHGFYVGRYETTNDNGTIGSKANTQVLTTADWYTLNHYTDSSKYSSNSNSSISSVNSSMIWGSQWDAMLNYMLTGKDKSKVGTRTGTQKNALSNSAQDSTDIINNIYDVGSNAYEWTIEAYSHNYRIYRGGSYDATMAGRSPAARGGQNTIGTAPSGSVPTDQGPIYGTRMALYIQNAEDTTGPEVQITELTSTSNTITVTASATDKESGIQSYEYLLSTNGGSSWSTIATINSNTYTYTGLLPATNYAVKVRAMDGQGNTGETEMQTISTSDLGEVAVNGIKVTQKYGSNGSGIVQLELDSSLSDSGYGIIYQINGTTGEWITGDTITGLTNGDIIYAKVSDGTTTSSDQFEYTVEGLEEYAYIDSSKNIYTKEQATTAEASGTKTSLSSNITYTDTAGNSATIPAGFKVGTTDSVNTINNGLVIQDEDGNEFVWVPVENAIYDASEGTLPTGSTSSSTYKPMARYQSGYSAESAKRFFEGIAYVFGSSYSTGSYARSGNNLLGTSNYREPTLVTNGADYTWDVKSAAGISYDTLENYYKYMNYGESSGVNVFNSYTEFGQYMNNEYSKMVQSVDYYGGFYIGRYETSVSGTVGNKDAVVQSQLGKTPINNQSWYKDYYAQDSNLNSANPYYESTSVTSGMIWGSQWDATLNWLLSNSSTKDFVNSIHGNHTVEVSTTGNYADDLANNIFDLNSNVGEWTQGGNGTNTRLVRGGYAASTVTAYGQYTSGNYSGFVPTQTNVPYELSSTGTTQYANLLGTRMSLYINQTEDTTKPNIELSSTSKGTNYITVTVNSYDSETGINNYTYSLYDSSTSNTPLQEITIYADTYTFEGLTQNSTYYIKIKSTNGAGLESDTVDTGAIVTNALNVVEGNIMLDKVYGKTGEGVAYFEINDELTNEGYYLQYRVNNGSWTTGDKVTGLSVGDQIETTIYDGVNQTSYIMSTTIDELETFSEAYASTQEYTDGDGKKAMIPAGFKVSTSSLGNKVANGLVVEDGSGNQYVWIPVENVIYDDSGSWPTNTSSTSTYKPMVRYQAGDTSVANQYYEMVRYNYSGVKSYVATTNTTVGNATTQREPSLVTGSSTNGSWLYNSGSLYDASSSNIATLNPLGITTSQKMGEYMNSNYTAMVQSIATYGGFYVGRYETSLNGTTVQSQMNQTPMASIDWYHMYLYEDSNYASNPYYGNSNLTCSMITGSQWDTMLNYILTGSDAEDVTAVTGNHTGNRASTGQCANDIMNNIFDLSSNVREWTQEADSTSYRVYRGGNYSATGTSPASSRNSNYPTGTYGSIGSRLALYIQ